MGAMVVLLGDPVVTAPAGTVREDAGPDDPVPPGPGPSTATNEDGSGADHG